MPLSGSQHSVQATHLAHHAQEDWAKVARVVVGAFRADITRAGPNEEASRLIDELSTVSAEFKELWADTEVVGMSEGASACVISL